MARTSPSTLITILSFLSVFTTTTNASIIPLHRRERPAEHVVLVNCLSSSGSKSSEMAYYSDTPGTVPQQDYATVNSGGGYRSWENTISSGLFPTGVTFTANIGGKVGVGEYAGSGENGYGAFSCWGGDGSVVYSRDGMQCRLVYDCDHRAKPAVTKSSSSSSAKPVTVTKEVEVKPTPEPPKTVTAPAKTVTKDGNTVTEKPKVVTTSAPVRTSSASKPEPTEEPEEEDEKEEEKEDEKPTKSSSSSESASKPTKAPSNSDHEDSGDSKDSETPTKDTKEESTPSSSDSDSDSDSDPAREGAINSLATNPTSDQTETPPTSDSPGPTKSVLIGSILGSITALIALCLLLFLLRRRRSRRRSPSSAALHPTPHAELSSDAMVRAEMGALDEKKVALLVGEREVAELPAEREERVELATEREVAELEGGRGVELEGR